MPRSPMERIMTENILPASYIEARISSTNKTVNCILHCNERTIQTRVWIRPNVNESHIDALTRALKKCPEFERLLNDRVPDLSVADLCHFGINPRSPSICLPSIYYAPAMFRCLGLYGRMVVAGNTYVLHFQSLAEWASELNEQAAYNDEPILVLERNTK